MSNLVTVYVVTNYTEPLTRPVYISTEQDEAYKWVDEHSHGETGLYEVVEQEIILHEKVEAYLR